MIPFYERKILFLYFINDPYKVDPVINYVENILYIFMQEEIINKKV